ncbi:MAG: pre-peptidase C-terminal domain-containing protein [Scytolyngbya sp. HA4215-MV1]|nr:pre-peptidase C-terminal domain-containing protein [Scytolyngbya sp. HA4215-MV1]
MNTNTGNTLTTAVNLSLAANPLQISGSLVNVSASTSDFYTFRLSGRSSLNFTLNSLTSNADVNFELLAGNGTQVLQRSDNSGSLAETINRFDQGTGIYYLRVYTTSNTPASYSLSLSGLTGTASSDIVWRNYGTPGISGLTALWTMNGVTPTNTINFPVSPNNDWSVVGTGDFNQDGEADLVWRNQGATVPPGGRTVIWTMQGETPTSTVPLNTPPVDDPNWRIEGVGDFNRDGQADLVWRYYGTTGSEVGRTVIWTMNGTTPVSTLVMPVLVADSNWQIVGVGDFTNDGKPDIVWRYQGAIVPPGGRTVIWAMDGVNPIATIPLNAPPVDDPNWRIDAVGDFNGDNQTDLLWRNYSAIVPPNGRTALWTMNGTTPISTVLFPVAVNDPNWHIDSVRTRFTSPPRLDIDGNGPGTEFNIGTLDSGGFFRDFVSATDWSDTYQFTLPTNSSSFNLLVDGISDNVDVYLYDSNRSLLQSSATAGNAAETISRALVAGTYYIEVRSANQASSPYRLSLSPTVSVLSDLSGSFLDVVQEPLTANDNFNVNFQVKNTGTGSTGSFRVGFYLSTDSTITTSDRFLSFYDVISLPANANTGILSTTLRLPDEFATVWTGSQTYYIGMVVDSLNAVAESNEGNNASQSNGIDWDDVFITVPLPTPTVSLSIIDDVAAEPNDSALVVVTRVGSSSRALTVNYAVGGSATNGADYSTLTGSAIIPAGQTSVAIPITVLDDTIVELAETVELTLTANSAYILGSTTTGTVSITDNDVSPFNIQFDYRFDTFGWFTPQRRAALESAALAWERILLDEFADTPIGTQTPFVTDPQTSNTIGNNDIFVTDVPIDDLLIFVGSANLGAGTLAQGGSSGFFVNNSRYTGSDFEPWIGSITFDRSTNWFFDTTPDTSFDIPANSYDFISVATHEMGHVLGFSAGINAFDALRVNNSFNGTNTRARNGGIALPLESGSPSHIRDGYQFGNTGQTLMSPFLGTGKRNLPTVLDIAVLDDIGYTVNYSFAAQNPPP